MSSEILFVDSAVQDSTELLNSVSADTEIVILDPTHSGINQITETLANRTGIDAVHILSHGESGSVKLGSDTLDADALAAAQAEIQQWGNALSADADILLYGCNVASGEAGVEFVEDLSQLIGADVAASNDLTGNATLKGDWLLEYATGMIEAPLIFQVEAMSAYTSVLATYTANDYNSLVQAIADANLNADKDTIQITSSTITLTNFLPEITEDVNIIGVNGAPATINGNVAWQLFTINDADVTLSNLNLINGRAKGGDGSAGGGGGLGAGGALFITGNSTVVADGILFHNNAAIGGNGGAADTTSGASTDSEGGDGGDGGRLNSRPESHYAGGAGGSGGTRNGNSGRTGGAGSNNGFGTGGGAGGGGGGAKDGSITNDPTDSAGNGGTGGIGGFGGGGGGGGGGGEDDDYYSGNEHGNGGVGGIGGPYGGWGGTGAYGGQSRYSGGGGGGAGLGGAVFVNSNARLLLSNTTFTNNSASGGTGGSGYEELYFDGLTVKTRQVGGGTNGWGLGGAIFSLGEIYTYENNPGYSGNSATDGNNDFLGPPIEYRQYADVSIAPGTNPQEGASVTNGTFQISLNRTYMADLTVYYTVGGSATSGTDYNTLAGSVVISAGQTTGTITVTPKDDQIFDPSETLTVTLQDGSNYDLGSSTSASLTLVDDEPTFNLSAINTSEGRQGIFQLTWDKSLNRSVNAILTLDAVSTATLGTDYQLIDESGEAIALSGNTFQIPVNLNEADKTITFKVDTTGVYDDTIFDPNETVQVTLQDNANQYGIGTATQTVTITENDIVPTISVVSLTPPTEAGQDGIFSLTLGAGEQILDGGVRLSFTVSGSATPDVDYELFYNNTKVSIDGSGQGVVTLPAGTTAATLEVRPVDDAVFDPGEEIILTLDAPDPKPTDTNAGDGYNLGIATATLTLGENDVIPVASITGVDPSEEREQAGSFTITLDNPALAGGVTIDYTIGGTAGATDHDAVDGSVFIPEGETNATVTITPTDDNEFDPGETIIITLVAPDPPPTTTDAGAGFSIGTQDSVTLTIQDNDVIPKASVSTITQPTEGDTGTFLISLDNPALKGGVTITYTIGGTATDSTDYQPITGTAFIPEFGTEVAISVATVDDRVAENAETVTLTLTDTSPGYDLLSGGESASMTIADDDTPGVYLSATSSNTTETGGQATIEVMLTSKPTENVTVSFSSSDTSEGIVTPSSLTFTPDNWDTQQTITITGVDDNDTDGSQPYSVTATVSSADPHYNGLTVAPLTLSNADDEGYEVLVTQASNSLTEGGATTTYDLALSQLPAGAVAIAITTDGQTEVSLDGVNFASSLTVTRTDKTPQTISVRAVDDATPEGLHSSSITHEIVSPTGDPNYPADLAIAPVTLQITDNDVPTVSIVSVADGSEQSTVPGLINLVLDAPAPVGGIIINYEVDGSSTATPNTVANPGLGEPDYLALSGSVFIAEGETGAPLQVTPTPDDKVTEADETVTINLLEGTGYTLDATSTATVTISDDDDPGVRIQESGGQTHVVEGAQTDSYRVRLTSQPLDTVTVTVASGTGIATNKTTLVFDANTWDTEQVVTVSTPLDDEVDEGDRTATITHTVTSTDTNYNGITTSAVTVNVQDDDTAGITLTQTANSTDVVENGATDTYSVVLTSAPTDPVTVSVNAGTGIDPIVDLTFDDTNWDTPQTVTVTATNDDIDEGDRTTTLTHTVTSADSNYNGTPLDDVIVSITEDDSAGVVVTPSGVDTTVVEGGATDTYTVVLTSEPTADVTVTLGTDEDVEAIAPLTFTAANWDTPQMVTVTAANDAEVEVAELSTITHTATSADPNYNGIAIDSVTANVLDRQLDNQDTAEGLNEALTQLQVLMDQELGAVDLPLVGTLDTILPNFIGGFKPTLITRLEAANAPNADGLKTIIASAIQDGFGYLGINDIDVDVDYEVSLSEVAFDVTIGNTYNLLDADLSTDLGLPGLGLAVDGSAGMDFSYSLGLGFGLHKDFGFYLDTETTQFSTDITLGLSDSFNATGSLGFLRLDLEDDEENPTAASVAFAVGLNDTDDDGTGLPQVEDGDRLTLAELLHAPLSDLFDPTLFADVNLGLKSRTSLQGSTMFPSFNFDLAAAFPVLNYAAGELTGPQAPTIAFNNMQMDLGSFISDFASPIIDQVNDIMEPVRPIIDFLNKDTKLLSTLGIEEAFDENNDDKVSVLELAVAIARIVNPNKPPKADYVAFFDAITELDGIIENLDKLGDAGDNLVIDLGSFDLGAFDATDENASATTATPTTKTAAASLDTQLAKKSNSKYKLQKEITADFTSSGNFDVPLLSDPMTALNLLLGKDVPLFTYDLPELSLGIEVEKKFPIWGPLAGLVEGDFQVAVDLAFGYDTYGFKQWKKRDFAADQSWRVLDGFYLSDRANPDGTGEDVDEITASFTVAAGAGLDLKAASGFVKGGIEGLFSLDFVDGGELYGVDDGRLRTSEIAPRILTPWELFQLQGAVDAFLGAEVSVAGYGTVWEKRFATFNLIEFSVGPKGNSAGTALDGDIVGGKVFFDADFDGIADANEPFTFTNADGSYDLDIPLFPFDLNGNEQLDEDEGQIVVIGGVDTSTLLTQTTPLISTPGATIVSPLTTLTAALTEPNYDAAAIALKAELGLSANLNVFNYDAKTLALTDLAIQGQVQNWMILGTQAVQDAGLPEGVTASEVATQLIDTLAEWLKAGQGLPLADASTTQLLLDSALSGLGIALNTAATTAQSIADDNRAIATTLLNTTLSTDEKRNTIVSHIASAETVTGFQPLAMAPLTTLAQAYVEGIDAATAQTQVKLALGVADVDLMTYDPLAAIAQGDNDGNGIQVFAKQAQIQNTIVQLSLLTSGSTGATSDASSDAVIQAIATQINQSGVNLSDADQVNILLQTLTPTLSTSTRQGIAQIIAESNQRIDAVVAQNHHSSFDKAHEIAKVQQVTQSAIAEDLFAVGAGTMTIEQAITENTGDALTTQVEASTAKNPALRVDLSNSIPFAKPDDVFAISGELKTIQVLKNDRDAEGNDLAVSAVSDSDHGTPTLTDDGTVTYRSKRGFNGEDSFYYATSDGNGSTTSEVTVKVLDLVEGDRGGDRLEGSRKYDLLKGKAGDDIMQGRGGIDVLKGQQGNDVMAGGGHDDVLKGGKDQDKLRGDRGDDKLRGGADHDKLKGNAGDDAIIGGKGNDIALGGTGADRLTGNDGGDRLKGQAGNDVLIGNKGSDILIGGSGDDILDGGAGNNTLKGGKGSDVFTLSIARGMSIITDFENGVDLLSVKGITDFESLTIKQSGSNTVIQVAATNQRLATLVSTSADMISLSDFI